MPKFEFFCSHCGLLFDKIVQEVSVKETECKSCKGLAKKHFKPHSIGVTYKDGLPPTATIDQIVGSDADKRWGRVNDLHTKANQIRRDSKVPVVEVSASGELKAASKENIEFRKSVADSVIKGQ